MTRFRVALLVAALVTAGCSGSSDPTFGGPFEFPAESDAASDLLRVNSVFARGDAESFVERSQARILVQGAELYQHVFEIVHSESPRGFAATLLYPAGGEQRQLAIESAALSEEGRVQLISRDGELHQNIGPGWEAQGYVGISFSLGAAPVTAASNAFGGLGRDAFVAEEQTELAGLAVTRYSSNSPEVIARMWASVSQTSGSLAPPVEAAAVTDGLVTVFATPSGLVVGFNYMFQAQLEGVSARFDGFLDTSDYNVPVSIEVPAD